MKTIPLFIFILLCGCGDKSSRPSTNTFDKIATDTHEIILRSYGEPMEGGDSLQIPGDVSTNNVEKLSELLKGLAAFYSALGGSY